MPTQALSWMAAVVNASLLWAVEKPHSPAAFAPRLLYPHPSNKMQLLSGIFPMTEVSLTPISWCWMECWSSWAIIWAPNLHPHTCSHKYRGTWHPQVLCLPAKPPWGWSWMGSYHAGSGISHLPLAYPPNDLPLRNRIPAQCCHGAGSTGTHGLPDSSSGPWFCRR